MHTTATDVAAILDAAANYIDAHGWCQGQLYQEDPATGHLRACTIGAIGWVTYGHRPELHVIEAPQDRHVAVTIGYLADYLHAFDDEDIPEEIVGQWNDNQTDGATVTDALRDAARSYRRERAS